MMVFRILPGRFDIFPPQESLELLLLFEFLGSLWVHPSHLLHFLWSHMGKITDKTDEFPGIFVASRFFLAAKGRHSGKSDAIVDDEIQLAVRQILGIRQPHIGRLWIQALAD